MDKNSFSIGVIGPEEAVDGPFSNLLLPVVTELFQNKVKFIALGLISEDGTAAGALGILIKADDPKGALPGVLKEDLPHEMKIVRLDRNSYFLIGKPHPEMILKLFLQNLTYDAKEKEAVLSVSYDIRRDDESFDELIKRLESS